MKLLRYSILTTSLLVSALFNRLSIATSAQSSAGLSLIETTGARTAALGEAATALNDDVASLAYNPGSLTTLKSSQASFLYQKGILDDSYGQFLFGSPLNRAGFGIMLGYYKGPSTELFDGKTLRTVTAQRDLSVSMGYAHNVGSLSLGVAGKYLSSELAETDKATAVAFDAGVHKALNARLNMGLAVQNLGSSLQYSEKKESLPQQARLGFAYQIIPGKFSSTFFADGVYSLTQKNAHPAVGWETTLGPLAVRAGYNNGSDLEKFTVGTGFFFGNLSMDYSFGFVQNLNSRHRVSLGWKFGADAPAQEWVNSNNSLSSFSNGNKPMIQVVQSKPAEQQHHVTVTEITTGHRVLGGVVYVVKQGDTLMGIARRMYGDAGEWRKIYVANRHLLTDSDITVGQKIRLP